MTAVQNLFVFDFYAAFRRSSTDEKFVEKVSEKQIDETDFNRIACPLCRWQPKKSSRWGCFDAPFPENFSGGCGTMWNTFETRALCPGCFYQWRWTTCLACFQNSPHADWYRDEEKK